MPSSGARSGMKPSRSERGAGDGRPSGIALECGHKTFNENPVAVYPDGRKLFACPECDTLVKKKRR